MSTCSIYSLELSAIYSIHKLSQFVKLYATIYKLNRHNTIWAQMCNAAFPSDSQRYTTRMRLPDLRSKNFNSPVNLSYPSKGSSITLQGKTQSVQHKLIHKHYIPQIQQCVPNIALAETCQLCSCRLHNFRQK